MPTRSGSGEREGDGMKIDVDCDAGQEGEETPRALRFGSRAVAVTEIIDRWLAPDHGYSS